MMYSTVTTLNSYMVLVRSQRTTKESTARAEAENMKGRGERRVTKAQAPSILDGHGRSEKQID